MKLRNLFVAAVAAVFALWSCEEEKPTLGITVEPDQVEIARIGGGCSIEITTDQSWTITVPREADWLYVDPLSGSGTQYVNLYAEANNGKLRSTTIIVRAGYDMVPVTVSQPGGIDSGDGLSMATAFTASEARVWVGNNLASGQTSATKYYVKGIIHKVQTTFEASGNYGNATFFISDDGQASDDDFECFQVYYLGGRQWKSGDKEVAVGDEVIVYGPLTLYNTTPETAGKGAACLVKLNDEVVEPTEPQTPETGEAKGDGSETNPFNVAAALNAVANLTWTANDNYQKVGPYFVTGKVVEIKENFDAVAENGTQYGNATFYIADEGFESSTFYCYRVKYFDNKAWKTGNAPLLAVGDEVVIYSELMNYRGNTPETVANSGYMIRINETTGTGGDTPPGPGGEDVDPAGNGTLESPYNVAAAVSAVANLTWTSNTDYQKVGPYYVRGKVSDITQNFDASGDFGNATFNLVDVDGGSNKLACYRILYFNGQKYVAGQTPLPAVGSEVIVYSELMNYRGNTPETVANVGYVYSIDGVTEVGGETPPGPGGEDVDPAGDGTVDNPYNVAAAASAVANLTWTSNTDYQKVGPYYVKGKVSAITQNFDASGDFGNATFDLVDVDGGSNKLACYRILYFNGQKYVAGQTPLPAVGSEVIVYSELMNYRGNTPETVANVGYVYSIDGVTEVGGETPPEPPADETATVSEILALETGKAFDSKPSLVVALTTRGFVATDGTKSIYVYTQGTNFGGIAKIGDMVKFSGVKAIYSNMPEVTPVTSVEVVSSNNNVSYPNPKDITASAATYSATEAEFVSLTGTLAKSGNYYNITIDGVDAATKQGSIVYPVEALRADEYDGKKITVTGYFNGLTSQNKYINIITTKVEEVAATEPVISNFKASFYQFGLSISWDAVEGATSYEWNLFNAEGAKVARGVTDQTAMRSSFGETSVAMENGFGVAWYTESGSLNGKYLKYGEYTLILQATIPGYTNEVSKEIKIKNEEGVLTVTKLVGTDTGFEAEWTPYTGADFSHYYWELHIVGENNQTSRAITGCTTDPYVRDLPTQTRYVDETHNTSWFVDGMVQGAKYYFIVVALAPKQNPDDQGNWPHASSAGRDHFTFGATYQPVSITLDFTSADNIPSGFPTATGTTEQANYQFGDYTVGFSASTGYYWSSKEKALIIGKANSFILLPRFEGIALKKVSFLTGNNASENVIVDVYEYIGATQTLTSMNVNNSALKKGTEYTWEINGKNDTYYALIITNKYNAQFQTISLYYQ